MMYLFLEVHPAAVWLKAHLPVPLVQWNLKEIISSSCSRSREKMI